jgi:hypothetical protein
MDDKLIRRFFAKVNKTEECWLWTASLNHKGYGQFNINGAPVAAHRVSWLIAGNTIPDDKPVMRHKCRNRNCVRPEHLEVGTHAENSADMIRDGNSTRGERCMLSKLTAEQVLHIRSRAAETHSELAREFGVARTTITNVINRYKWNHI